jgi:hypothetical protein
MINLNKKDPIADAVKEILQQEALKGNQHKIDKNHNNKIDGEDFKILRGDKKEVKKEEVEPLDEISKELATSYLNKREAQHKPNMNSPETSNRDSKVAKGIRGAVSRSHGYGPDKNAANKVTGRFEYRKNVGATHTFNKEENEETKVMSKSLKQFREGWDDMLKAVKERNKPQPNGGSGVKQGSRYGGSKQKDEPEKDTDEKK